MTTNSATKWFQPVLVGLTFMMVVFQMVSSQVFFVSTIPYLTIHLTFCILITILYKTIESTSKLERGWCYFLLLMTVVSCGYVLLFWETIHYRAFFNTNFDLFIGVLLIFLSLEATRIGMGMVLPAISLFVVIYGFGGQYLPQPFTCQSMGLDQTISNLSVAFEGGVYAFLHISANFLFLFVIFGGVLNATGASRLFIELGRFFMGKVRGGAAMMAVIASAGVGSITGSAAANVAVTGPITIPLMKKTGYRPYEAGGIEAAASNGGQIMPPVMGMVAFAMSGLTGIPYLKIVGMAIIPAIVYFLTIGLYVYLVACKNNILIVKADKEEKLDGREWAFASLNFLLPITIIIVLLYLGYSINFVGFWAIISVIGVSLIRKKTRPSLRAFIDGFMSGVRQATAIGASIACVGLILSTMNMSGLGVKLVLGIEAWSHGYLFFALVLITVISVILGMGGASITAYIIVSIFTVPALEKMGLTFAQGHFYAMFVAVFAFLTPPVAVVALIASRLAKASYIRTSIESTKAALGGFLLPFFFAYCPILLLQPKHIFLESLGSLALLILIVLFEASFVGYYLCRCAIIERAFQLLAGLLMFIFVIRAEYILFVAGLLLFVLLTAFQWIKRNNTIRGLPAPVLR